MIHLTQDLVSGKSIGRPETNNDSDDDDEEFADDPTALTSMDAEEETRAWLSADWKSGDRCRAIWSEDQQ